MWEFRFLSDFRLFCSSQNPIFRLVMHWKAHLFRRFRFFQTFSHRRSQHPLLLPRVGVKSQGSNCNHITLFFQISSPKVEATATGCVSLPVGRVFRRGGVGLSLRHLPNPAGIVRQDAGATRVPRSVSSRSTSTLHFYSLQEGATRPQMLVASDVDGE